MRLYEGIGVKYRYHGIISGIGISGNVYANSLSDLKRKASKIANCYYRPVDVMQVWDSKGVDNKPIFNFYRRNRKTPWGTFNPGQWN